MWRGIQWLAIAALLGGAACPGPADDDDTTPGDDDGADDDDTTPGDDDAGLDPCTFGDRAAAEILVEEKFVAIEWRARVSASVQEHPDTMFQTLLLEGGECRYLKLLPAFCDPPCEPGELCTPDGECEAYPEGRSAGTLTVEGLGEPLVIEEYEYIAGQYFSPDGLPEDLFGPGDPISAALSGDEFPAVALGARGVAPMDPDLADTWLVLVADETHEVTWTAGVDPDACAELLVHGPNSAHGMPLNDIIWCVGPDDGAFTIPAAMVALFPMGTCPVVAVDCPPSELTRYTRQTRETDGGDASLTVRSTTWFPWRHDEE